MKNKKLLIVGVILAIVVIFIITKKIDSRYQVNLQKIENKDAKYFLLEKDNKYGVIDSDGKVVIKPDYAQVAIPDPRKDLFIVTGSYDNASSWKAINSKSETKFAEYDSVEPIFIESVSSNIPFEKSVLKYKSGSYYGLISIDGKKITDAKYESIETVSFKEGYLKVKKDGSYGVITIKGTKLIDTDYDEITSDGYYNKNSLYSKAGYVLRTRTDDGYKYGYANYKGKIILDQTYSEIKRINTSEDKNIYLVTVVKGRYGLLKNKKKVLDNEYDSIEFNEKNKVLFVSKNGSKGAYNLDGKQIIPIDYDSIYAGGDYINAYKSSVNVVFDKNGKKVDTQFTSYEKISNGKAIVITEDDKYNIIDEQNKILTSEGYVYIEYFDNDLYIASRNDYVGVINSNGNTVVPFEYSTIQKTEKANVLIAQKIQDNEINIVTKEGKVVKGLKNANYLVKDKFVKIYSDKEQKYYTLDGKETTYKELYPQNGIYADVKDGKWGAVNSSGNLVIKYEYDKVTELTNGEICVLKDGKWGIYSKEGKVVVEPKYTSYYSDIEALGDYYRIPTSEDVIPVYTGTEK